MKVAHIIPSLKFGGAQRLVVDICNELNNYPKIEYVLIIFKNKIEFKVNNLNIKHIETKYIPRVIKKPINNTLELRKFLDYFSPNIIHSHLWESEITLKAVGYSKAIRLTHFHSNIPQFLSGPLLKKKTYSMIYERHFFLKNNLNFFICISTPNLNYIKKKLPKSYHHRLFLIPNGINLEKFKNKRGGPQLKSIKLIMVGSFVQNKNQKFAIKILNSILELKFKCFLTFLGDGPMLEECKTFAENLGISENISFKGNNSNVSKFLKEANIYIHTAKNEAFGLSIIEAMANGLPVVTLNGGGNGHFIENGINGYCYDTQDELLFRDTIINLFQDNNLYSTIGTKGYLTSKKYTINILVTKLMKIYEMIDK